MNDILKEDIDKIDENPSTKPIKVRDVIAFKRKQS